MKAINKAIKIAGGQSALARQVGCTYQVVQHWIANGYAPAKWFKAIETATGGQVSRMDLLSDLEAAA